MGMAIMLCCVKVTKALNDNFAAVVYNYLGLETWFLIGLAIAFISQISAFILGMLVSS